MVQKVIGVLGLLATVCAHGESFSTENKQHRHKGEAHGWHFMVSWPGSVVAVAANPIRETRGVYAGESIFPNAWLHTDSPSCRPKPEQRAGKLWEWLFRFSTEFLLLTTTRYFNAPSIRNQVNTQFVLHSEVCVCSCLCRLIRPEHRTVLEVSGNRNRGEEAKKNKRSKRLQL